MRLRILRHSSWNTTGYGVAFLVVAWLAMLAWAAPAFAGSGYVIPGGQAYSQDQIQGFFANSSNSYLQQNASTFASVSHNVEDANGNTGSVNQQGCCTGLMQFNGANVTNYCGCTQQQFAQLDGQTQVNMYSDYFTDTQKAQSMKTLTQMQQSGQTLGGQPVTAATVAECAQLGPGNCQKSINNNCSSVAKGQGGDGYVNICTGASKAAAGDTGNNNPANQTQQQQQQKQQASQSKSGTGTQTCMCTPLMQGTDYDFMKDPPAINYTGGQVGCPSGGAQQQTDQQKANTTPSSTTPANPSSPSDATSPPGSTTPANPSSPSDATSPSSPTTTQPSSDGTSPSPTSDASNGGGGTGGASGGGQPGAGTSGDGLADPNPGGAGNGTGGQPTAGGTGSGVGTPGGGGDVVSGAGTGGSGVSPQAATPDPATGATGQTTGTGTTPPANDTLPIMSYNPQQTLDSTTNYNDTTTPPLNPGETAPVSPASNANPDGTYDPATVDGSVGGAANSFDPNGPSRNALDTTEPGNDPSSLTASSGNSTLSLQPAQTDTGTPPATPDAASQSPATQTGAASSASAPTTASNGGSQPSYSSSDATQASYSPSASNQNYTPAPFPTQNQFAGQPVSSPATAASPAAAPATTTPTPVARPTGTGSGPSQGTNGMTQAQLSQAIANNTNGGYVNNASSRARGNAQECASMVRALNPQLPPTSQWTAGAPVSAGNAPRGTPVMTSNFTASGAHVNGVGGTYAPPGSGGIHGLTHTGVVSSPYNPATGQITIANQWNGSGGVRYTTYTMSPGSSHNLFLINQNK